MTLIAAIRCETGVVVCADSQETVDHYRVSVDKIKPRDCRNYDLVIGGAGPIGSLLDGQADAIERYVETWEAGISEEDCRSQIEAALTAYTTNTVKPYLAPLKYKVLMFVICLRDKTTGAVYLWKTDCNVAQRVNEYVLIGWEEELYEHEAKRLFKKDLDRYQATIWGLHLLALGKATSNYIGDPFQVIAVERRGPAVELPDTVEAFQKRIKRTNDELSKVLILTPDLSVSDEALSDALKRFGEEILGLRREVRQLQISDSLHGQWADHISLSVGSVEPESPLQNPQPKKRKKTTKRKKP